MGVNLASVHQFVDGAVLTAAQLNALDDNIRRNHQTLISPMDGDLDSGGHNITNAASVTFNDVGGNPAVAGQVSRIGTILKYFDGGVARANQVLQAVSQSGIISNIDTETSLYNFTVPAFTLGDTGQIETKIKARFGLLSGSSVLIKAYYGTVAGPAIAFANQSATTADLTICPMTITLAGAGASNAQNLIVEASVTGIQNILVDAFASTTHNLAQVGAFTIDSTTDQLLQINVVFSSADAANQCDYLTLRTMVLQ